jgi:predicted O-linked N-acetylglucosamine transferase (SPINDLY family)
MVGDDDTSPAGAPAPLLALDLDRACGVDRRFMTTADILAAAILDHRSGRPAAAAAKYRRAAALAPDAAEALHGLGLLDLGTGRPAEASRRLGWAVRACPDLAKAHGNRGAALRALGDAAPAAAAMRRALALDPGFARVAVNLANTLKAQADYPAAAALYRRAIRLDPALEEAHNNLGTTLLDLGRRAEAGARFAAAMALRPAWAEGLMNLGAALHETGRPDAALALFDRVLRLAPQLAAAHNNRGSALRRLGRLSEAVAAFQVAVAAGHPDAPLNLAAALRAAHRPAEAAAVLRAAMAARPGDPGPAAALADLALSVCDFAATDALAAAVPGRVAEWLGRARDWPVLGQLAYLWPYLDLDEAARRPVTDRITALLAARAAALPRPEARVSATPGGGAIRVGYVSADFGDRPMGHVTRRLFVAHDRTRVAVAGYALRDRSGEAGAYWSDIRAGCDVFADLSGLDDSAAAARIAADGIDVLVDLTGFMSDARPLIFALRPAPVQVYWLGHHGGRLGLPWIDWILADPVVLPPSHDTGGPERVVRLPEIFHPADTPLIADAADTRREHGLDEGVPVFCAFNNPQKIDRTAFATWMRVLARLPGAQLWLSDTDPSGLLAGNLRRAAVERGVAADRLVFAPRMPDKARHFARHRLADLFLDCFRATASTTALDALWAGLPVLTVAGRGFGRRIAASMVTAAGLPELVCADAAAFEDAAVALARDPQRLADLRARLRRQRSEAPLFDVDRLAGHLEDAFGRMVDRRRADIPAADIDVPARPRRAAP